MLDCQSPSFAVHGSRCRPLSNLRIENFHCAEALASVVPSNGVQLIVHHSNTNSAPEHGHCFTHLPDAHIGIVHLNCTQGISCVNGKKLH